MLKIGIIGAGHVSRGHLGVYARNPLVQVVALTDVNEEAGRRLAGEFSVEKFARERAEVLEDPSIDVVDVCTPHFLHYPVVMEAFRAGKDVICEKPIAMKVKEADEMIAMARDRGKRFLVVLNQRFLPAHVELKRALDEGKIGRPFLMVCTVFGNELERFSDAGSWKGTWDKAGGGVFGDTGTHLVDLVRFLFGEVKAVQGCSRRLVVDLENKADDNTVATLEMENGTLVSLVLSYTITSHPWSEKKALYGTQGSLHVYSEAEKPLWFMKDEKKEFIPVDHELPWWPFSISRCLNHFVECLVENKEARVTPEDAREALRTVTAVYRSSREERRIDLGESGSG